MPTATGRTPLDTTLAAAVAAITRRIPPSVRRPAEPPTGLDDLLGG